MFSCCLNNSLKSLCKLCFRQHFSCPCHTYLITLYLLKFLKQKLVPKSYNIAGSGTNFLHAFFIKKDALRRPFIAYLLLFLVQMLQNLERILFKGNKPIVTHSRQLPRQRAAVSVKIIRQIRAVEGNRELLRAIIPGLLL